jgi:acyl-CoA synthetase (NDP forming)
MGVEEEVAVIEKLASLDNVDAIITGVPRDRSLHAKGVAAQRRAVINAVEQFCEIPKRHGTPIIARSMMPSETLEELLREAKIPVYDSVEECVLATYALARYAQIRRGE